MSNTHHSSSLLSSMGLALSLLTVVSMVACQKTPAPSAPTINHPSSATASIIARMSASSSASVDPATVDADHRLLIDPTTSKNYHFVFSQTSSGQTIALQDATLAREQMLLSGVHNIVTDPASIDYRFHTLFVVRRITEEKTTRDELWAYTMQGGKRLMQGRNIQFVASPQANMVAVANATGIQIIDVRLGSTLRTLSSADLPQDIVAKKERFFGKVTSLMPWAWSDDGSVLWFSANSYRPYAFATFTVRTGTIDTYVLAKDFTSTDTALNANTGNIALSDANKNEKNTNVTLSLLNLKTNESKTIDTATGGALHPQWLNNDTLFVTKNGKKTPISLR